MSSNLSIVEINNNNSEILPYQNFSSRRLFMIIYEKIFPSSQQINNIIHDNNSEIITKNIDQNLESSLDSRIINIDNTIDDLMKQKNILKLEYISAIDTLKKKEAVTHMFNDNINNLLFNLKNKLFYFKQNVDNILNNIENQSHHDILPKYNEIIDAIKYLKKPDDLDNLYDSIDIDDNLYSESYSKCLLDKKKSLHEYELCKKTCEPIETNLKNIIQQINKLKKEKDLILSFKNNINDIKYESDIDLINYGIPCLPPIPSAPLPPQISEQISILPPNNPYANNNIIIGSILPNN